MNYVSDGACLQRLMRCKIELVRHDFFVACTVWKLLLELVELQPHSWLCADLLYVYTGCGTPGNWPQFWDTSCVQSKIDLVPKDWKQDWMSCVWSWFSYACRLLLMWPKPYSSSSQEYWWGDLTKECTVRESCVHPASEHLSTVSGTSSVETEKLKRFEPLTLEQICGFFLMSEAIGPSVDVGRWQLWNLVDFKWHWSHARLKENNTKKELPQSKRCDFRPNIW